MSMLLEGLMNTHLAGLEYDLARPPTNRNADDLGRNSQAQERGLRDESPARSPQLDEIAADEEVEDAAQRRRHTKDRELKRGAGVDLTAVTPQIRRAREGRVVRVEDVAFHKSKYVDDPFIRFGSIFSRYFTTTKPKVWYSPSLSLSFEGAGNE
jgi:hypothetical protein